MNMVSVIGRVLNFIIGVSDGSTAERPHPSGQSPQKRMYAAANTSRLSAWGQSNTSADSELNTSLRTLRTKSRALVRDASYAKRAKVIIVNNIVGMGIGLQAQVGTSRGELNKRINDDIEAAWTTWTDKNNCHTGGTLHLNDNCFYLST